MCNDHKNVNVEILDSSIDIMSVYQSFIQKMASPRAISVLIGYVDHHNQNKKVKGITYDMHTSLAEKTLLKICKEAQHRFDKNFDIYAAHTKGYIEAGGLCTLVQVSANNFQNASDVSAYIGEQIRRRLPIWKLEHYIDGTSQWLPGQFQLKKSEPKPMMADSSNAVVEQHVSELTLRQ